MSTIGAGLLAGVLPALSTRDVDLTTAMKNVINAPGGRRGWWRNSLVVGQITVTVVLLIAAGLLVRTLGAIGDLDPGFDARGDMLIARLDMHKLQLQQEHSYYRAVPERLSAMPGITGATVASRIPLWGSGGGAAAFAWIPGLPPADADGKRIGFAVVSSGYFPTLGTRIVSGRAISEHDNETSAPVAVLNESAARLMWPAEEPIGKHFRLNGPKGRDIEGRAFVLAGLGIALGVALAIVFGRVMSAVVYGVSVRDPLTFVAAAATMALVTLVGAAIPARRAASIDPIRALRED